MTMKRLLLRNGFYFEDVFDCHYRLYIIMHLHVGYTLVSAESCYWLCVEPAGGQLRSGLGWFAFGIGLLRMVCHSFDGTPFGVGLVPGLDRFGSGWGWLPAGSLRSRIWLLL